MSIISASMALRRILEGPVPFEEFLPKPRPRPSLDDDEAHEVEDREPEYATVDAFAEHLADDDRSSFSLLARRRGPPDAPHAPRARERDRRPPRLRLHLHGEPLMITAAIARLLDATSPDLREAIEDLELALGQAGRSYRAQKRADEIGHLITAELRAAATSLPVAHRQP
jgi:hypothetical protein